MKNNDGTHATFAKFLQVFRSFRGFGDMLGPVRTFPDVFGRVRMRSEAFGRFWKFSKNVRACANYRRSQWWNVCSHGANHFRIVHSQAWKQQPASPVISWNYHYWNYHFRTCSESETYVSDCERIRKLIGTKMIILIMTTSLLPSWSNAATKTKTKECRQLFRSSVTQLNLLSEDLKNG